MNINKTEIIGQLITLFILLFIVSICCLSSCKSYEHTNNTNTSTMMQYEYMYNHQQLDSVLVTDDNSICKIRSYAKVNSDIHLKSALLLNELCPAAFPVISYDNKFWKGKDLLGYHCVVITGFDENGFDIRNSWGKS